MDIANQVIEASYKKKGAQRMETLLHRSAGSIRAAVASAKRFVLDESMSAFMADLATVPFKVAKERRADVMASLRHSARLPFPKMMIEYDGIAFKRRLMETSEKKTDPMGQPLSMEDTIKAAAWLLEQDDADADLIWITEFTVTSEGVLPMPVVFAYRTDDRGFSAKLGVDIRAGQLAHGVLGCVDAGIGVRYCIPLERSPQGHLVNVQDDRHGHFVTHYLVAEMCGLVRYALGLLSTLNDTPKVAIVSRPQKGFLGGGQIRKYLDHTTLSLSLPTRMTETRLANRLIAQARRGWHEVRPHWRVTHHGGRRFCADRADHIWLEADETGHANCKHCDARRVWITLPHGRGDPTISVRTHRYAIKHDKEARYEG